MALREVCWICSVSWLMTSWGFMFSCCTTSAVRLMVTFSICIIVVPWGEGLSSSEEFLPICTAPAASNLISKGDARRVVPKTELTTPSIKYLPLAARADDTLSFSKINTTLSRIREFPFRTRIERIELILYFMKKTLKTLSLISIFYKICVKCC